MGFAKQGFSVREENQVGIQNRLVSLVGEKPIVSCQLDALRINALWDTGSMVSMVSLAWLRENFPDVELLSLQEFVEGDNLHLVAANNTSVGIEGVVVLKFCVNNFCVPVPFVVCREDISVPIIGYNVIKHLVLEENVEVPSLLKVFPSLSEATVSSVVAVVRKEEEVEASCAAWTKTQTVIPPHSRVRIKCRTNMAASAPNQSVMFTPGEFDNEIQMTDSVSQIHLGRTPSVQVVVVNPTNASIVVPKDMVLGSVEAVGAVIPISPKQKNPSREQENPSRLFNPSSIPGCFLTPLNLLSSSPPTNILHILHPIFCTFCTKVVIDY